MVQHAQQRWTRALAALLSSPFCVSWVGYMDVMGCGRWSRHPGGILLVTGLVTGWKQGLCHSQETSAQCSSDQGLRGAGVLETFVFLATLGASKELRGPGIPTQE